MTSKPFIPYTTSLYENERLREHIGETAYRRRITLNLLIPTMAIEHVNPTISVQAHLLSSTALNRSLF
jgi:hypothetical protein